MSKRSNTDMEELGGDLKRLKPTTPSPRLCSGSTLHSLSLNSPGATVRDSYVVSQARFVIVRRLAKVTTRGESTVTYLIKAEKSEDTHVLHLKSMWAQLHWMKAGMLINIVDGNKDDTGWTVDRLKGYLIVEPDRLVSVTSVISQLYCERKAALSRFYMGGDSAVTFRGVVAHELICAAMVKGIGDVADLSKVVKRICQRPGMLERAYGIGMTDEELQKIQTDVVEWVARFMKKRFLSTSPRDPKSGQDFTFKQVIGVEDNIWNPKFGLKGKIDATVRIQRNGQEKTTPLEFKTGSTKSQKRQTVKADHTAQVNLYTLMMSTKFGSIDEALLYYISDDSLSSHTPKQLELQFLIMHRNSYIRNTTLLNGEFANLPRADGIDFDFKCKNCEVRNICTMQLTRQNLPREEMSSTEKKLVDSCELSEEELQFFWDWLVVINSETEEVEKRFNDKDIWLKTPEQRESNATCVANLKITGDECVKWKDSCSRIGYMATFKKKNSPDDNDHCLHVDDFVALSSNVEINISYGIVVVVRGNEVTLSFEQPLHPDYFNGGFVYAVDKINTSSPIASQYGYLAKLMDSTVEASRIRELIIKKNQPKFARMQVPDPQVQKIIDKLNGEQKRVVTKSLVTDSFLFVKGTPGSGKTATIVALLRTLVSYNKSVLVVSYTGTALENILLRFKDHHQNFIKISTSGRSDSKLTEFTTKEISKSVKCLHEMENVYNKPVVATTLLSLKHAIFQRRRFDYCIIDEASQALPTAVFGVLSLSEKYIVFGDPHQLPPVMTSSILKTRNMSDNFFSLMSSPVSTVKLNRQYRMNYSITKLANALVYDNQMVCGSEDLEKAYLKLPEKRLMEFLKTQVTIPPARTVLCGVVSKKREKGAVFVDTSNVQAYEQRAEQSLSNESEKNMVITCARILVECGLKPDKVGIIAPYRGQVKLIRAALSKMPDQRFHSIEVNTVDQYQGREMEAIICSFTKSMPHRPTSPPTDQPESADVLNDDKENKPNERESILEDIRRLNVAITRARVKLIMIGNISTLSSFSPFRKLFGILENEVIYRLTPTELQGMMKPALNATNENVPATSSLAFDRAATLKAARRP